MTSARQWALLLLFIALAAGAYLRLNALDSSGLSADEAASWAAAAAPSVASVLHAQAHLNPGELGLHDLALHFWIGAFGDSVVAMRYLSAVCGVVAILLVFLVTQALLALAPPIDEAESWTNPEVIAGLAAILFAVNLIGIKYAREARMYPLALALTLAQVWCFLRALRSGSVGAFSGIAIFTAAAIATTFTSILILIPEALFLLLVSLTTSGASLFGHPEPASEGEPCRRIDAKRFSVSPVLKFSAAIAISFVILAPLAALYLHNRAGAPPNLTTWSWIAMPPPWAALSLFNKALGTYAFPLFAILALSGALRAWPTRSAPVLFLLLWILLPPIVLTVASYAFHPAFVERYLLACFAPFFILAALGIAEVNPAPLRPGALALVLALSLAHVQDWRQKPHGEDWAAAATIAAAQSSGTIGVAPRYASNVVRYYLIRQRPDPQVTAVDAQPAPGVIIVDDSYSHTPIAAGYSRVLARPRGLTVRSR